MRTKSLAGALIALLMMAGAAAASAQEVTQAEKDKGAYWPAYHAWRNERRDPCGTGLVRSP